MVSSVTYQQLRDARDRAARFRRLAARGISNDFDLEQTIIAIPVPPPIVVNAAGWAKAGVINDPYASPGHLVVWWNPDTNEVKVEKPMAFREPAAAVLGRSTLSHAACVLPGCALPLHRCHWLYLLLQWSAVFTGGGGRGDGSPGHH